MKPRTQFKTYYCLIFFLVLFTKQLHYSDLTSFSNHLRLDSGGCEVIISDVEGWLLLLVIPSGRGALTKLVKLKVVRESFNPRPWIDVIVFEGV